jgi:hypothetical protein
MLYSNLSEQESNPLFSALEASTLTTNQWGSDKDDDQNRLD